jgi:hypothetical protein
MVDLTSISLVWAECKWLRSNSCSDVDVDLSAQFTQRNNILLILPYCDFGTNLSSLLSGDLTDIMYRIIVCISLEDRVVLLSIDTINRRINIIDGSSFNNFSCIFNVISNNSLILSLLVLRNHSIVQNSSIKPRTFVKVDVC